MTHALPGHYHAELHEAETPPEDIQSSGRSCLFCDPPPNARRSTAQVVQRYLLVQRAQQPTAAVELLARSGSGMAIPLPNADEPAISTSNGGRRRSITRTVLDNLELEALEQRRNERKRARGAWLILPNSRFLKVWLAIIGPLIVYNVIWVPLEVSQMAVPDKNHAKVDFILDLFFLADLIINFRTAYVSKENELVLNGKAIACRYLKGSFAVDFVATVPWEVFATCASDFCATPFYDGASDSDIAAAFAVLRLPRLLRLLRLFKKLDMFPSLKLVKVCSRPASELAAASEARCVFASAVTRDVTRRSCNHLDAPFPPAHLRHRSCSSCWRW